ncbi:zinc-binding dehydrogenase [Glycomyces sp. NPDC047010]|uniref:zinc-binding dehydrogenase n=1 Tax=Glycomyces sp. NPDC047010 TaxID=3155023 RepID=UPI0034032485
MHAIRHHEFGGPEVLRYEEVADPEPGPGQVRIDNRAAGVHLLDTGFRSGESGTPFPLPELPTIPGREAAGIVDAVGEGVDSSWLGKRVVTHLGPASQGYAEKAVREVESVHELPEGVDFGEAVAMIGTGRTALLILAVGPVKEDDVVIVPAAAGGLGTLLVQAAKNAGAYVIGLAGGVDKVRQVAANGADAAIDYRAADWTDVLDRALEGREASLFFDSIGGEVGRAVFERLGFGARMVVFGWSAGKATEATVEEIVGRGLAVSGALGPKLVQRMGGIRALEEQSLAELAAGRLRPAVHTFKLAEAAEAHRALENRGTTGKVVLVP